MTSFYTEEELAALGLKAYGRDVRISRKASLYGAERISVGDHVRIDDFCLLSGSVTLGSYVHLAAGALLFGGDAGVTVGDYSTLSSRCAVYALTDDYSGAHMTNPTVPEAYTGVTQAPVSIGRHVIVGTGSTVLPGVTLGEGCAVGAMTLLRESTQPWGVYYGVPAVRRAERSRELLRLCEKLEKERSES
ncbi:MAG: acyltransferase [Oscillospiraceae bacterium]|nr:acyltransferase [Oscillospiraceae bacterium]